MIEFEAAQAAILREARPLPAVTLPLADAAGRYLLRPLRARFASPRFDQSAMDGYAVRVADVAAATPDEPVRLPVKGVRQAGAAGSLTLRPGTAVKIFTGAAMPRSGEAVVMREYCHEGSDGVAISRPVHAGENVRYRGEECPRGEELLAAGTRITPPVLGLLAFHGQATVAVRDLPRVTIVSIGDELIPPGQRLRPGQIYNSNGPALAAALAELGIARCRQVLVRDDAVAIRRGLAAALRRSDVVISAAGVSVGDYDFVTDVTDRLGLRRVFYRIKMKPGKPVLFGTWRAAPGDGGHGGQGRGKRATLFFGLPGNPVSALVTFELLVQPALRAMMGAAAPVPAPIQARLATACRNHAGRTDFQRGLLDLSGEEAMVTPLSLQGSHMLAGLAGANCLIQVPLAVTDLAAGETVRVWPLIWGT